VAGGQGKEDLSGTTAARGWGMRAGRRNNPDDINEALNEARSAVVPDIFRRMSRIQGDFTRTLAKKTRPSRFR